MLAASSSLLNIPVAILDVGDSAPAKQVVSHSSSSKISHVDGSFTDPEKITALAAQVDVLTVEIEHVDVSALEALAKESKVAIHPSPSTIKVIQDKFIQKQHLFACGCPISPFMQVQSTQEGIAAAAQALGLPLMLKSRTLAYDGRGNYVLRGSTDSEISSAISALGNRPLYAEKWVPFTKEIAVMVVRSATGETRSYPAVETVHKDNICHLVFAPLRGKNASSVSAKAQAIAEAAIQTFDGAGVFAVEMFLMENGRITVTFPSSLC